MTLSSLSDRRGDVEPFLKIGCKHQPADDITLPVDDFMRDKERPHETPPSSTDGDNHLENDHVSELHDLDLSSTVESLIEIPLNSIPLSHPPSETCDDPETTAADAHTSHDADDSSPTSLPRLHRHAQPITTFTDGMHRDAEIPESKSGEERTEDIVDTEPDVMRDGSEKVSFEQLPLSMTPDTSVSDTAERNDFETRPKEDSMFSPSACDEIVETIVSDSNSHAGLPETCPRSRTRLDMTVNKRSRRPSISLDQSACEVGSSKTEAFYHSTNESDDTVDMEEPNPSTIKEEVPRDRETLTMAVSQPDIQKRTITHSHSTPDFMFSNSVPTFSKVGGPARTLSGFARLDSDLGNAKEVIIPKPNENEDIVHVIESRVTRKEGSKDSLSKSRGYLNIPETQGTLPSEYKGQCDSGNDLGKTSVSPASEDGLATEIRRVDSDHQELSMDSSSTSLRQLEPPKPGLAHSAPTPGSGDSVCSSSDLDRVEKDEKILTSPHEIKRTYSSSVDSLVEEDIETLTTTSIPYTIFSVTNSDASHPTNSDASHPTNSDASHPTNSSPLTGSNESAVNQRLSVKAPSDVFDIERDPLSASSVDAAGAWREDHNFPRPHSRVKRMYSSSDSNPDSVPDHEDCIEISDNVTEALANNHWDVYASGCRRCSSTIERRELEGLRRSGRIPHTGFTSSESMDSIPAQTAEATPLLRGNSSRSVGQRGHSEGRARRGMKSTLAKKAVRLLNFVLGKKNRAGKNHPESQAKMKKRSLSSLLCGRSS